MQWTYDVVDVFTSRALEGNPLAVFLDGNGLDGETMQRIARELNLSETVFLLPPTVPQAAARLRIFTPGMEMPFAGHPTIGTAYVVRERGFVDRSADRFLLEERIGLVNVRVEDAAEPMLWLKTPAITFGDTLSSEAAAAAAGLSQRDLIADVPCQILTAGPSHGFLALATPESVDRAALSLERYRALVAGRSVPSSLFIFARTQAGVYARMFGPDLGVAEDPATGSATGPLAAFMMRYGLISSADGTRFVSEQGTKMGRRSLLHVLVHGEAGCQAIEVGGNVTPIVTATLTLPAAAQSLATTSSTSATPAATT